MDQRKNRNNTHHYSHSRAVIAKKNEPLFAMFLALGSNPAVRMQCNDISEPNPVQWTCQVLRSPQKAAKTKTSISRIRGVQTKCNEWMPNGVSKTWQINAKNVQKCSMIIHKHHPDHRVTKSHENEMANQSYWQQRSSMYRSGLLLKEPL